MPYVNEMPRLKGYTKSNYKLHCYVCDCTINRGDEITQVAEFGGMTLRCRVATDGGFYTPYTGARWIHKNCKPIYGFSNYIAHQWAEEENRWMADKISYITTHLNLNPNLSYFDVINEGIKRNLTLGTNTVGGCLEDIVNNIMNDIEWENEIWDTY